jgi:hypothetical protein
MSWCLLCTAAFLTSHLQRNVACHYRAVCWLCADVALFPFYLPAQVLKHRYERVPPPYRRRMRNVLTFLYSGLYNITYPKTGLNRGRSDSTSSVATANGVSSSAHAHTHAHGGECQLILCNATCTVILKCTVRLLTNVLTVSRRNASFRGVPLFLHQGQRCLRCSHQCSMRIGHDMGSLVADTNQR